MTLEQPSMEPLGKPQEKTVWAFLNANYSTINNKQKQKLIGGNAIARNTGTSFQPTNYSRTEKMDSQDENGDGLMNGNQQVGENGKEKYLDRIIN